jgi:serine phosphatase RsbU (regulator of sigma subunit)
MVSYVHSIRRQEAGLAAASAVDRRSGIVTPPTVKPNMTNPDIQLELQVGVAKLGKYATRESGDTLEMIERPHGGVSLVLVDGQRSGLAAKRISNLVARKAISLLAEGVRDGAAARAAHDYLRTYRQGKVSAELHILSLDLVTRTLVVSRNSHCPVYLVLDGSLQVLDAPSQAIGVYSSTKPVITELGFGANTWVVAYTDGILHAGRQPGHALDVGAIIRTRIAEDKVSAPSLADAILSRALELDLGRPQDDMSVAVVAIVPGDPDETRRMSARFPLPPF